MTPRLRILAFGSAAASVLAGLACVLLVSGIAGEVLAVVLMSAGFAGAVLLLFLEVGLGEERDLERERERRRGRERRALALRRGARLGRRPRRPL